MLRKIFFFLPLFLACLLSCQAKVLVVGAGLGGLTTAYRLAQHGVDVEVYEARGRVGGRVWTVQQNGLPLEVGGQNILDGGEAQHLLNLAEDLGLSTESSHLAKDFCYADGKSFQHLRDLLNDSALDPETLWTLLQDLSCSAHNIEEVLQELFSEEPELYVVCTALMSSFIGGPVDLQSSVNVDSLYEMLMAELSPAYAWDEYVLHLGIKGGNDRLAKEMAAFLGERVHLDHALRRVAITDSGDYELEFGLGAPVEAEFLVLAIPCSVYGGIEFGPGVIDGDRLEAIRQVRYANCSKVLLPLQTPLAGLQLVNGRWVSYFPGREQQLVLYYVNEASLFDQEDLRRDFGKDLAILQEAYGERFDFSVPTILSDGLQPWDGPIAYNWSSDPWAQGAYTFEEAGKEDSFQQWVELNGESFRPLFLPINERLFFAGEHTSTSLDYAGTMESAVESGERVARYLLKKVL